MRRSPTFSRRSSRVQRHPERLGPNGGAAAERPSSPPGNVARGLGRREALPGGPPDHRVRVQPHCHRPVRRHPLRRAPRIRILLVRHQHGREPRVQPGGFRLGHSMLTETFKVIDPNIDGSLTGSFHEVPLLMPSSTRPYSRRSGRPRWPRGSPASWQRGRRVCDAGAATEPARPTARSRHHQHRARPRCRTSHPQRVPQADL